MMITEPLYQEYLTLLLDGNRVACSRMVQALIVEFSKSSRIMQESLTLSIQLDLQSS